jgi:hypothetical protein
MRRRCTATAAAASILAFGAAACGGGNEAAEPPPPPPPPPAVTPQPPTPQPPPPAQTTIRVVFKDGKVVGGLKRFTLEKGDKVVLVVVSDVDDEVHLHGYDKTADVTQDRAARLAFVATIPGRFEVELEDRGIQIADLEVRP